jgi:hypothetical protein
VRVTDDAQMRLSREVRLLGRRLGPSDGDGVEDCMDRSVTAPRRSRWALAATRGSSARW